MDKLLHTALSLHMGAIHMYCTDIIQFALLACLLCPQVPPNSLMAHHFINPDIVQKTPQPPRSSSMITIHAFGQTHQLLLPLPIQLLSFSLPLADEAYSLPQIFQSSGNGDILRDLQSPKGI